MATVWQGSVHVEVALPNGGNGGGEDPPPPGTVEVRFPNAPAVQLTEVGPRYVVAGKVRWGDGVAQGQYTLKFTPGQNLPTGIVFGLDLPGGDSMDSELSFQHEQDGWEEKPLDLGVRLVQPIPNGMVEVGFDLDFI